MKLALRHFALGLFSSVIIAGCSTTRLDNQTAPQTNTKVMLQAPLDAQTPLTLKQIMANPDWMGILAKGAYWSDDSQSVYFYRQKSASPLKDYYQQPIDSEAAKKLAINELHKADQQRGVINKSGTEKAYLFQGNVFVKRLSTGVVKQLTRFNRPANGLQFLVDNDIAFWQGNAVYRIRRTSGLIEQIADIKMAQKPKSIQAPQSYIAKQQHRLIEYVALQQSHAVAQQNYKQQRQDLDPTVANMTWYLGDTEAVNAMSVSPSGRYIILSLIDKNYSWRGEHDIMPNYLGTKGYVDAVPARARVAEDNPPGERLVVLDLEQRKKVNVTIEGLIGYDEDVLASVKSENANKKNQKYDSKKQPRKIQLMQDWGWRQSAVQWQQDGDRVALMIEAVDNKDRWLTTLNLATGQLTTQHRLHDDAWVNYNYNQFGWVPNKQSLYFLSEHTGYSQLYTKALDGKLEALTQGRYVVSQLELGPEQEFIYYRANKDHPGIENVYRVYLNSGKSEQLTNWQGKLDYDLSPDGQKLLLQASKRIQPNELYIQHIGGELKQLTHYTSDVFTQYPWQAPEVVRVPSTHGANDVYARVYLPQGFDPSKAEQYPAVIFNHGAGYLQNAHYGFSGYFREFMFHNLLTQKGYVVMDMDYRGSKGYGRDWRTAIYRNMGHPEVEDLKDGVSWLATHANVDRQRVGTYGGSYGGFLTFMALFNEPDLFQAGAALRPVTDWAHYNAPYTSNILNTPDVDPIAYERSSPIEHAQGLTKPLLIMSGVLDDNVFFQDSVRLVQRLIELEKPMFETAIYPVEPHGFKQPSSWLDEYRRIFKLFEQNLKNN